MGDQLSLLSENAPEPPGPRVLSVSEVTKQIKQSVEANFASVSVEGEISNFKLHSSGHMYFSLKDSGASISAVMWRSRSPFLRFVPEDGMKVVVTGRVTVYEVRGNYQLDVWSMRQVGEGELQLAFEKLKKKLAAEGLFDEKHKKVLPEYPRRVGIVTSPTGAALDDMLLVLRRRFPSVEVILNPVRVQGAGASGEIARAIREFNDLGHVDLLIVGRGGGSPEDLWAFNEEEVARAIFKSDIPIICAVGHEIDFTIADFVADARAATPTAAAELAVPDRIAILEIVRNYWYYMRKHLQHHVNARGERIQYLLNSYAFNRPVDLLRQYSQRVDEHERNMRSAIVHKFALLKSHSASLHDQLQALNPASILRRGYAIVRKDKRAIGSALQLKPDDAIDITFHDGNLPAKVNR